jgi:hypothetical protein
MMSTDEISIINVDLRKGSGRVRHWRENGGSSATHDNQKGAGKRKAELGAYVGHDGMEKEQSSLMGDRQASPAKAYPADESERAPEILLGAASSASATWDNLGLLLASHNALGQSVVARDGT